MVNTDNRQFFDLDLSGCVAVRQGADEEHLTIPWGISDSLLALQLLYLLNFLLWSLTSIIASKPSTDSLLIDPAIIHVLIALAITSAISFFISIWVDDSSLVKEVLACGTWVKAF